MTTLDHLGSIFQSLVILWLLWRVFELQRRVDELEK